MSCRVTTAVAGGTAARCPAPDEAAGENAPTRHADTTPAATTATMPRAAQRRRPRDPLTSPAARTSACCPASRPRVTVLLTIHLRPFRFRYGRPVGQVQRRTSTVWRLPVTVAPSIFANTITQL